MKVAILGSGAMGSLYGAALSNAGCDVTLIDVWKEHVDAVNAHGLRIEDANGERIEKGLRAAVNPSEVGAVDLVVVFVKATATESAMRNAMSLVSEKTMVLTLQNGLGNVDKLNSVVGADKVIAGTSGHGATLLKAGYIRHAGVGMTVIGEQDGRSSERIQRLAAALQKAGFDTKISNNVIGLIWTKLMANIGVNALTALTGLLNGQLLEFPETEEIMKGAVAEAAAVAKAKGIKLETDDPLEHTREIARKTAPNRSSMFQDVLAKRRSEVAVINGAIVEEGKKLGIPTPVNAILTNLMLVREKTY